MANLFYDAFNPALTEMERIMGGGIPGSSETWMIYPLPLATAPALGPFSVISIEAVSLKDTMQVGGKYQDASNTFWINKAVATTSGVIIGSVVSLRADPTQLRVLNVVNDGDDSLEVICGPFGVNIKRGF